MDNYLGTKTARVMIMKALLGFTSQIATEFFFFSFEFLTVDGGLLVV